MFLHELTWNAETEGEAVNRELSVTKMLISALIDVTGLDSDPVLMCLISFLR